MKLPRRTFLHLAAGAAALPAVSHIARAQIYPTRPITIVAPFAAGRPTDALGRLLAQPTRASLGQNDILGIASRGGGTNSVTRVAPAAPYSYTFRLCQNGS